MDRFAFEMCGLRGPLLVRVSIDLFNIAFNSIAPVLVLIGTRRILPAGGVAAVAGIVAFC